MAVKAKKPGRALRVADQIARDIAELIPQNVRDPRVGLVTITGCEITPDYAHAKLFYKKLTIHTVPTLHFVLDESVARGFAMDRVIEEAMQETRRNEASEGKTE